jgi:hypothetical protein
MNAQPASRIRWVGAGSNLSAVRQTIAIVIAIRLRDDVGPPRRWSGEDIRQAIAVRVRKHSELEGRACAARAGGIANRHAPRARVGRLDVREREITLRAVDEILL